MSQPALIAVLAPHRHPRLRYVLAQLSDWWRVKLRLFTDPEQYRQAQAVARINYGSPPSGLPELLLFAHDFLSGKAAKEEDFKVAKCRNESKAPLPCFFVNPSANGEYDALSIIFFCLSRYEEYQEFAADAHGRFPAAAAHAVRYGYLSRPIVNLHLLELARQLNAIFPDCHPQLPAPTLQLTYDVDVAYAYRLRGWRGSASGLRDLFSGQISRAAQRAQTVLNATKKDPYDTFNWLQQLHDKHELSATYFWLLAAEQSTYNPNASPETPALKQLIRQVSQKADYGIHPSYHSSDRPALFTKEKETLASIIREPVNKSRQHFLRFRLPETYRELHKVGLRHDYSMGYADAIGYRAGTNLPFYWYDLEKEKSTYLRVHPFVAMDVTLLKYLNLSYFEVPQILQSMAKEIAACGGPFTLLWHNSSFAPDYGWEGWAGMYAQLVADLKFILRTDP